MEATESTLGSILGDGESEMPLLASRYCGGEACARLTGTMCRWRGPMTYLYIAGQAACGDQQQVEGWLVPQTAQVLQVSSAKRPECA